MLGTAFSLLVHHRVSLSFKLFGYLRVDALFLVIIITHFSLFVSTLANKSLDAPGFGLRIATSIFGMVYSVSQVGMVVMFLVERHDSGSLER